MAVKIFSKVSYNINGVASPSITFASAWVDELNELNSDEVKIGSFLSAISIPFFMNRPTRRFPEPDTLVTDFSFMDKSPEEILASFGLFNNENYPIDQYARTIGFVGDDMATGKMAFIMNNLAFETSNEITNHEPAKAFFHIHKLTTAEIDSFTESHPELNTMDVSAIDLYNLLSPCIATKNNALEADGYRQATKNGYSIVFYADSIVYQPLAGNPIG